jgi:hypothetical protein
MPGVATVKGDLLTPTLGDHRPRDWTARLPWQLGSQVFVAFLGGPVAVTIIAVLNGLRLRMPPARVALMVAIGVAGTIAGVLAAGLIDAGTAPRLLVQVAGVVTYGPLYLLQRSPDRVHSTFSPHTDPEDDYGSLWGPGLAAVIVGWAVQFTLVELVMSL